MSTIHLIYDARDKLVVPTDQLATIGASCIILRLPDGDLYAEDVPNLSRELALLFLEQLAIAKG